MWPFNRKLLSLTFLQYCRFCVVLLLCCTRLAITLESVDRTPVNWGVIIEATEQYFPVMLFIMPWANELKRSGHNQLTALLDRLSLFWLRFMEFFSCGFQFLQEMLPQCFIHCFMLYLCNKNCDYGQDFTFYHKKAADIKLGAIHWYYLY